MTFRPPEFPIDEWAALGPVEKCLAFLFQDSDPPGFGVAMLVLLFITAMIGVVLVIAVIDLLL